MEGCRAGFVLCCPGGLWWWRRAESVAGWLRGHASPPEHRARADPGAACASASLACAGAGACPCSAQPLAGPSATAWPFASASQPLTGSSTCANSGAKSRARSCACA